MNLSTPLGLYLSSPASLLCDPVLFNLSLSVAGSKYLYLYVFLSICFLHSAFWPQKTQATLPRDILNLFCPSPWGWDYEAEKGRDPVCTVAQLHSQAWVKVLGRATRC